MTRRAFLLLASSFGLLSWNAELVSALLPAATRASTGGLSTLIAQVLRDFDNAKALGWRYLETYPNEGDRAQLIWSLFPPDLQDRTMTTISQLRQYLAMQRKNDFEEGRTVLVDGWILAQTEARICALGVLV